MIGEQLQPSTIYAAVFEAIDAAVERQRCLPSTDAHVQRALVLMRGSGADPEAVRQLEAISVRLHALTAADLRGKDGEKRAAAEALRLLAGDWMARLPMQ